MSSYIVIIKHQEDLIKEYQKRPKGPLKKGPRILWRYVHGCPAIPHMLFFCLIFNQTRLSLIYESY